jgi:hypothetical protein
MAPKALVRPRVLILVLILVLTPFLALLSPLLALLTPGIIEIPGVSGVGVLLGVLRECQE